MQIFRAAANAIARPLCPGVSPSAGIFWVLAQLERTPYITIGRSQEVAARSVTAHQHHFTGLGIDCRYCHTSVEQSSFGRHSRHQDNA